MSNIGLNPQKMIGGLQSISSKKEIIPTHYFFGHLTIEKILKSIYVNKLNESPPHTHRLVHLVEKITLELTEEQLELFETITDFNMEARYPDEKFSFKKRCTKDFAEKYLRKIEEIRRWLLKKIRP